MAWIRDRRKGVYEQAVPSTSWFDRLGVLVKIGTMEKVYDLSSIGLEDTLFVIEENCLRYVYKYHILNIVS